MASSSSSDREGHLQREGSVSSQLSHVSGLYEFNHQDIHASCPEKIIICIDLDHEVETTTVISKDKGDVPLLNVWKNALELFVWNKHLMNSDHEFAIVILTEQANWFCDFMKEPSLVCQAVSQLEPMKENYQSFDIISLYSIIHENCPPPPPMESPVLPPPFVVRAVLLYGRSYSSPVYRGDVAAHDELIDSPHFFLDVLYSHEPPSGKNLCETTFDVLAEMYPKPKALVLDWSHSVTQLFNSFAKMLAHPLQRPIQHHMDHKLQQY